MIFMLGECDKNCLLASRMYKVRYPDRKHPREESFRSLLVRFTNTGNVNYVKHNRTKSVTTEENEFRVLLSVTENPHVSTRELSDDLSIERTSIRRLLKNNKFHPFHVQLHQELKEQDYQHRIHFCTWMQQELQRRDNILENILFTDECTFHRNGFVNRHNFHYYSDVNPHLFRVHSQQKWTVNVWAGIIGTFVVGPFFFDGTLNSEKYEHFLEHHLFELLENIPLDRRRDMYFQQDGAPPHHARRITDRLNATFGANWIGRAGPVHWPARSPDLTPLDFFLWGYVKSKVYELEPTTVEDMKVRIRNVFQFITLDMLEAVKENFVARLQKCLEENGRHFEHLM